jgi:membrane-associated phospholipid phosphatase
MPLKNIRILAVSFAIFFALFTLLVSTHLFDHIDLSFMRLLNQFVPHAVDIFFLFFSLLGIFELTTALLLFVCYKYRLNLAVSSLLYIVGLGIEMIGKEFLYHPAPPGPTVSFNLGFFFPSSFVHIASSYPSGHSFRTVFLAVLLTTAISHMSSKKARIIQWSVITFTVLMLISRVSLAEHWFTDVVGGTLLGLACGYCAILFSTQSKKLHRSRAHNPLHIHT